MRRIWAQVIIFLLASMLVLLLESGVGSKVIAAVQTNMANRKNLSFCFANGVNT